MGSKRALAKNMVDFMVSENPNAKYIYDLFGGGGAITFEAVQRFNFKKVFYNELNKGVVELIRKIFTDGVTEEFYQWVSRETFFNNNGNDDWFGGLCKTIWSFGNNQTSYIFGKDIEAYKKLLHYIIVYKEQKSADIFEEKTGVHVDIYPKNKLFEECIQECVQERRMRITRIIKKKLSFNLGHTERLAEMQQLERLEQLQPIQQIQGLTKIRFLNLLSGSIVLSNKSYDKVEITTPVEETIIYLDPPYEGIAKYQKSIDYSALWQYMHDSKYKIYLSSYKAPFNCVKEFKHRSTLSATNNSKKTIEKLFVNYS